MVKCSGITGIPALEPRFLEASFEVAMWMVAAFCGVNRKLADSLHSTKCITDYVSEPKVVGSRRDT